MERAVPQPFTSFESLLRFFSDADEIVFQICFKGDDEQIACLCRESRQMAHHLHMHFGTRQVNDLARVYGVEILRENLQVPEGDEIHLTECTLRPPKINLNPEAIALLAKYGQHVAGQSEKRWFTETQITEVATAYELYHVIRQKSSLPSIKMAAHCFARTFTRIPFSSLLYNVLLQQARDRNPRPEMDHAWRVGSSG